VREQLIYDMNELVDDLYAQIRNRINKEKYAIYGHSMGALVSLLITRKLRNGHLPLPVHLFMTGTGGPSANWHERKILHLLSKEEFMNEIIDLDGCSDEIFRNSELLKYVEPILRADLQAAESYDYEEDGKLNIPITVITGTEEQMESEVINAWQNETQHKVDFRVMPGKHFFIFKNAAGIMNVMEEKLFQYSKTYHI